MAAQPINLLASRLGELLMARRWRVTTAESCTGGGIAAAITDVAGASAWFEQGFVTYSNRVKEKQLGVPAEDLSDHGAVSEAVVKAMASGALRQSQADIGVAVSGIAGPDGGTAEKPVGTVWVAWATQHMARQQRFHFSGNRAQVRQQTLVAALEGLISLTEETTV